MTKTGYPSIDKTHLKNEKISAKHPIIPNMSVVNSIGLISSFYRDAIAVDCLDLNVSYQELLDTANILARSFKELQIKENDIISVSMPNFFQAIAVYLAANKIGAITTFLNPGCSIEETKHYLNEFESPLFVNYDKNLEYNNLIKKDTKVRQIITLNKNDLNVKKFNEIKIGEIGYNNFLSFNDLKLVSDYYKHFINPIYGGKQDSLILFTSGSTGMPKSVVLTNENILASGIYMKNTGNIKAKVGERCLVCVPFSYPYGFATSTLMSLLCGRTAILAPNLSKDNLSYYASKNPNIYFGSPALLELMKKYIPEEQDLSSAHSFISGGDFLSPSQAEDGIEFFNNHGADVKIFNGSGNAESTGASTNAVGLEVKPSTVGKILLGSDAIIVNPETMEELKYDEEGMLCISGKHIFKSYFKNSELTKDTKFIFKGKEYLKTGTIGKLGKDGYFTLTGRASRFYIRADLNKVYCEHVQQVINSIDVVESCVVVPKPDDELLYTGHVFVVLKNDIEPTNDIKKYIFNTCNGIIDNEQNNNGIKLKDFEIPKSIEFLDAIPRNDADKIDYELLQKMALEQYEIERDSSISMNNKVKR